MGREEVRGQEGFGGCRGRLWATQARWALLRARRLLGRAGLPLGGGAELALDPARFGAYAPAAPPPPQERAWRVALALEALHALGDARWVAPLWREAEELRAQLDAAPCALGGACAPGLMWLLEVSRVPWGELPSPRPDLAARAAELRAWAAAKAAPLLPHAPSAALAADAARNARESWWGERAALAALTLSDHALRSWLDEERAAPGFDPAPPSEQRAEQGGLSYARALGLGLLAARLADPDLAALYAAHLREGLRAHLELRRDYRSYSHRAPPLGLWALSAVWGTHFTGADGGRAGGWALTVPPALWRAPAPPATEPLPPEGFTADGMFSKLAVRDTGATRGLYFVRPGGAQVLESEVDLARPHLMQVAYTQELLAAYAFVPSVTRALIVGLGGGGMLHALSVYHPALALDVVEIDPVVVDAARRFFGVGALPARVITRDGFEHLRDPAAGPYDVIYMDAFLQPSDETDPTGSPLNLKTVEFLKEAQRRLSQRGALIVNLNEHPNLARDISTFRAAFAASHVWQVPHTGNWLALGLKEPVPAAEALKRAREASEQLGGVVALEPLVRRALGAP